MREFRKKQKKLFKTMKAIIILSAVFIFVYIGAQPYVAQWNGFAALVCSYICDFLVIANMCIIFSYYNKYGKSDKFLEVIEYEIDDYGYYFTAREEKNEDAFVKAMQKDFTSCGFAIKSGIEIDEFDFSFTAMKKKEFFYVTEISSLSKDDILAYIDVVINDITVHNLKRSGNAVVCFVTDKPQEDAIALSKMITPLGKKEQIKIAVAIAQPNESRCYFLGNMPTKCQQMIASYVLKCSLPIADKYKGERHLPFQDKLEIHMADFNIKDFKNGTFYAH